MVLPRQSQIEIVRSKLEGESPTESQLTGAANLVVLPRTILHQQFRIDSHPLVKVLNRARSSVVSSWSFLRFFSVINKRCGYCNISIRNTRYWDVRKSA